mgnify:FL=1
MDKVIAESIKDNQDFKILSQIYDDIETGKVPIRIEKYQLTQNIYKWKDQECSIKEIIDILYLKSWMKKGKGKYILENVKIGENLYSICGDKYFIEDDIVPIFEDVLNDKIQLNEEENIEYRFHLFLVSMPASIVRALTLTMTNKENIRQQKIQRSFHYATDEEQKKIASSFWILWNKNISIPELLSCCFPSLFSPEEIQIIQNKYMEFEKKEDFTIWFDQNYDAILQDYINKEFQGSSLRFNEYIRNELERSGICPLDRKPTEEYEWKVAANVVKKFHNEYQKWEQQIMGDGYMDIHPIFEYEYRKPIFFLQYYYFHKRNWEIFFDMMNGDKLSMDEYNHILSRMKEEGLNKYVQKKYNEYKRITSAVKDIVFVKELNINEVSQSLSRYYRRKKDGKIDYKFDRQYLLDIIEDIISELHSGLDVAGFIYILWRTHFFDHAYFDDKFTSFRDKMTEIFQLSDIPSIKEYTEKKPKTKDKAYKLWDQWDVFQRMIDKTALD